jgi:guanylate kinase
MIFVISGPSGSGKTTLRKKLLKDKELKSKLANSISFTTRPKRLGEQNGRGYFFISEEEFKKKLKAKKILEWTKYLGYYYGTPKDFVETQVKKRKHLILCLDLKGAARIKQLYPENTVTVFILPPSFDTLRDRIGRRGKQIRQQEITQRLKLAKKELLAASKFDYSVVNENLAEAVWDLKDIILKEIAR